MPCDEDFEKWDTNVRKDFLRKWYHTRSKRVQTCLLYTSRHAPDYLFGQVGGVVFGVPLQHAFQNDTLGPVGNDLGGGHHLDPVLFQKMCIRDSFTAMVA